MYDICCAGMWVSWDMPTAVGITRQTAANIDGNMYAHHSNTTRSMQRKSVQIRDANDLSPKEPTQQRNQSDHPRLNQPSASLQRQGEDGRKWPRYLTSLEGREMTCKKPPPLWACIGRCPMSCGLKFVYGSLLGHFLLLHAPVSASGCAGMEGPVNVFHQDNGLGDGVKLWWWT